MRRFLPLLLAASILPLAAQSPAVPLLADKALPADETGLPGEGALRRYEAYVKRWQEARSRWAGEVAKDQGAVVFLGDSITQGWGAEFKGLFPGMKLANRGIGGDTTRGMLIRLEEDVLALQPSAIVLLLGTNDIEVGIEPAAIGRNFQKILAAIQARLPQVPIVLCRMFPSSASKNRPAETIRQVNALYEAAVKGDARVTVIDTWTLFADPQTGDMNPAWAKDLLHLNPAGYARWAAALRPVFATLGFIETEAEAFTPEPGFESLFNGRDLTGGGVRPTPLRKVPAKPRPSTARPPARTAATAWSTVAWSSPRRPRGDASSSFGRRASSRAISSCAWSFAPRRMPTAGSSSASRSCSAATTRWPGRTWS